MTKKTNQVSATAHAADTGAFIAAYESARGAVKAAESAAAAAAADTLGDSFGVTEWRGVSPLTAARHATRLLGVYADTVKEPTSGDARMIYTAAAAAAPRDSLAKMSRAAKLSAAIAAAIAPLAERNERKQAKRAAAAAKRKQLSEQRAAAAAIVRDASASAEDRRSAMDAMMNIDASKQTDKHAADQESDSAKLGRALELIISCKTMTPIMAIYNLAIELDLAMTPIMAIDNLAIELDLVSRESGSSGGFVVWDGVVAE